MQFLLLILAHNILLLYLILTYRNLFHNLYYHLFQQKLKDSSFTLESTSVSLSNLILLNPLLKRNAFISDIFLPTYFFGVSSIGNLFSEFNGELRYSHIFKTFHFFPIL